MKRLLYSLIVISLLSCTAREVPAQQPDGCSLTSWILQQEAGSHRSPEISLGLRDTTIVVNSVAHKISIPPGFTMSVFTSLGAARGVAISPDGTLYATGRAADGGAVYAFPDHNGDGIPDSSIKVWQGLGSTVHGIGFHGNDLYVSNVTTLYKLEVPAGSRIATSATKIVDGMPTGGHDTRTFTFDDVKKKIYMEIGSGGNMETTDPENRATIMEYNFDGTGGRIFARGLRNAVGTDLDPRTGALWVNNNGMDDVFGDSRHNDVPPECVYLLCDGANYGWPYAYGFRMRNPANPIDTSYIESLNGPVAEVLAHSAPLGLHFYRGNTYPSLYKNAIFQTYHGSWDRQVPAPPRITVLWADADGRNARVADFVNGFQPDSNSNRWGRVVGVTEGPNGELYFSDDNASVIYKIAYTGAVSHVKQTSALSEPSVKQYFVTGNPIDGNSKVSYQLGKASEIRVELYDVLGQRLATLKDQHEAAGSYEVPLPLSLPTGAIYARLTADGEVQTLRLLKQ